MRLYIVLEPFLRLITFKMVRQLHLLFLLLSLPDFATVQSHMEPKIPCYILFKLDAAENRWLCLSYVPDGSPVKQRMLYASTRDAMKKQLGKSYFVLDMYGSTKVILLKIMEEEFVT
jgi:hypothetical protein